MKHTFSFLWLFLQVPELIWWLRNVPISKQSPKNVRIHEWPHMALADGMIYEWWTGANGDAPTPRIYRWWTSERGRPHPPILLFIIVIWKVEKKRKNERLNLKNHFFSVFPKSFIKFEYHDASEVAHTFDLSFRICREKCRGCMEKRRAYFFRAITLSFLYNRAKGSFQKSFFFCGFLLIFLYWCVVWSRFFYWRKEPGQADLSDTLNMFVKPIENFLDAFEKKVSAQQMGFCPRIFQPDFELHFFKISTFFTFPEI